jgi:parallel beta-helix repeat protein
MIKRLSLLVVTSVLGGMLFGATADAKKPPPTPVTINCASEPGLKITTAGRFRLTRSVFDCASVVAIEIDAPGKTVDLNLDGRTIDSDGGAVGFGIYATAGRLVVRNGTFRDHEVGVRTFDSGAKISGISVHDPSNIAIRLDGIGTVTDCVITDGGVLGGGIGAPGGSTVKGNVVEGSGGGISISAGTGGIVSQNRVSGSGPFAGISSAATRSVIRGNTVIGGAGPGIEVTGTENRIRGNVTDGNDAEGILLTEDENLVFGNRVVRNDEGISVAATGSQNVIAQNVVRGNTNNGILDSGTAETITKNTVAGNLGTGINVASGHVITRNKVSGNGGWGILGNTGLTVSKNTVNGNGQDGVNAVADLVASKNTTSGNRVNGILVSSPDADTSFTNNVANENGQFGLATTGAVEVPHAGNTAKDNGGVTQCSPDELCN